MDRSISYSPPSVTSVRDTPASSAKLESSTELDSPLSTLGHIGLVKHQRDSLRNQFNEQILLINRQKHTVASFSRLSFRLAVLISVKEAQLSRHAQALSRARATQYVTDRQKTAVIDRLEATARDQGRQAQDLLHVLTSGNGDDLKASKDGQRSGLPRPAFPPHSASNPSSVRTLHTQSHSQRLPPEIIDICKERVVALLHQHHDLRQTLESLYRPESSLQDYIKSQEREIYTLKTQQYESKHELKLEKDKLSSLEDKLLRFRDTIWQLEKVKASAESNVAHFVDKIKNLEQLHQAAENTLSIEKVQAAQLEVENRTLIDELMKSRAAAVSLTGTVPDYDARLSVLQQEAIVTQQDLSTSRNKLSDVNQNHEQCHGRLTQLQETISVHEREKQAANVRLDASVASSRESLNKLNITKNLLLEASAERDCATKALQTASENLKIVQQSEISLRLVLQQNSERNTELESMQKILEQELFSARILLANFAQSSSRFAHELYSEKARSSLLDQANSTLSLELSEMKRLIKDLQCSTVHLDQELACARNDEECSYQRIKALEHALDVANQDLKAATLRFDEKFAEIDQSKSSVLCQLVSTQDSLSQANELISSLRTESGVLKDSVTQLGVEIVARQQSMDASERSVSNLRVELNNSKSNFAQLEGEKLEAQVALERAFTEREELRNRVDLLQISHDSLEKKVTQATEAHEDIASENMKLQSSIQGFESVVKSLRSELSTTLETNVRYEKTSALRETEENALVAQIQTIQSELLESKAHELATHEQASSNQAAMERLQQELQTTRAQMLHLQHEWTQSQEHRVDLEWKCTQLQSDLVSAQRTLKEVVNAQSAVREELHTSHNETAVLRSEKTYVLDQLEKSQNEISQLRQDRDRITAVATTAKQESAVLRDQVHKIGEQYTSLANEKSQIAGENRSLVVVNENLSQRLRRVQRVMSSSTTNLGSLRIRLATLTRVKRTMQVKLCQAETKYNSSVQQNKELELRLAMASENEKAADNAKVLARELTNMRKEHDRAAEKYTASIDVVSEQGERLEGLTTEVTDAEEEIFRLTAMIHACREEIQQLGGENSRLLSQREEAVSRLRGKDHEIRRLQALNTNAGDRPQREAPDSSEAHETVLGTNLSKESHTTESTFFNPGEVTRTKDKLTRLNMAHEDMVKHLRGRIIQSRILSYENTEKVRQLEVELQQAQKTHQADLRALRESQRQIKAFVIATGKSRDQVSALQSTIRELEKEKENKQKLDETDDQGLGKTGGQIEDLIVRKDTVSDDLTRLEPRTKEVEASVGILRESQNADRHTIEAHEQRNKKLTEDHAQLSRRLSNLQSTVRQLETQIEERSHKISALLEEKSKLVAHGEAMQSDLKRQASALQEHELCLQRVQKMSDEANKKRHRAQEVKSAKGAELSKAQKQERRQDRHLQAEVEELKSAKAVLIQIVQKLERRNAELVQQVDERKPELDKQDGRVPGVAKDSSRPKSPETRVGPSSSKSKPELSKLDVGTPATAHRSSRPKSPETRVGPSSSKRMPELSKHDVGTPGTDHRSSRPKSSGTRVGTSTSMAASKSQRPVTAMSHRELEKKRGQRMEEHGARFPSLGRDEDTNEGNGVQRSASRAMRKLQKLRHHENHATSEEQHGKVYNLLHFGSINHPNITPHQSKRTSESTTRQTPSQRSTTRSTKPSGSTARPQTSGLTSARPLSSKVATTRTRTSSPARTRPLSSLF